MLAGKPDGSTIHCSPDKYANFLSSLVFLVSIFYFCNSYAKQKKSFNKMQFVMNDINILEDI